MMRGRSVKIALVAGMVVLGWGACGGGAAWGDVSREAVMGARAVALADLERQVDQLPLGNGWTVGKYLDDIDGRGYVRETLARAQLIGGPRVLGAGDGSGDSAVQVRLDIPGRVVAEAVGQVAAVRKRRSPIAPEVVVRETQVWADRTFTAVGVTGGAGGARPTGTGVVVPAPMPQAPSVVVENVATSQSGDGPTTVSVSVGEVRVTTEGGAGATGAAEAGSGKQAPPRLVLDQPPAWVFQGVDAGGTGAWAGSKLETARAAEGDAMRMLASQLEGLEVNPGVTLGSLAKSDARWGEVIRRALERARVYRVEYFEDGSAGVKVSTEPRYVWQDVLAVGTAVR
jgi:hypothetical protein